MTKTDDDWGSKYPPVGTDQIYVFGSNLAGRHGKGTALIALREYGAHEGIGEGHQGRSYAIPTKDRRLVPMDLWAIKTGVDTFIRYAVAYPELSFYVTRVGCGLAGYTDADIGPLFAKAPLNCQLPTEWDDPIFWAGGRG